MIELKNLLQRFEKIIGHEVVKINLVLDVLNSNLKFEIPKDSIKVKGKLIILNIKPLYKNEVLLKKEALLSILRDQGLIFDDIR